MKEFKSNCKVCGHSEFDEHERHFGEEGECYCKCGNELEFRRNYSGKNNTYGFNEDHGESAKEMQKRSKLNQMPSIYLESVSYVNRLAFNLDW